MSRWPSGRARRARGGARAGSRRRIAAQDALRAHLEYPDQIVRLDVLESLRLSRYAPAAGSAGAAAVLRQLDAELDDAAWTLAVRRDLPPEPAFAVLSAALAREVGRSRQAILLLLSFVHDPVAIQRAREGLAHASRRSAPTRSRSSTSPSPPTSSPACSRCWRIRASRWRAARADGPAAEPKTAAERVGKWPRGRARSSPPGRPRAR